MTKTLTGTTAVQLDRAHIEGQVIASNLDHLKLVLPAADGGLHAALASITAAFGLYVERLSDARTIARASERRAIGPQIPVAGTDRKYERGTARNIPVRGFGPQPRSGLND